MAFLYFGQKNLISIFICIMYQSPFFVFLAVVLGNFIETLALSWIPIFMLTAYYLPPLFSKNGKTYNERLKNSFKKELPVIERGVYFKAEKWIGKEIYLAIIITLIVLPIVSGGIGYMKARKQAVFMVTEIDNKKYALLRSYQDYLILIEYEEKWIDLYYSEKKFMNKYLLRYRYRDLPPYKMDVVTK